MSATEERWGGVVVETHEPRMMPGLSFAQYQAIDAWNWSKIRILEDKSPLHVRYAMDHDDTDTAARGALRAVHTLVLEPDRFDAGYALFDGVRRGKVYDAFVECHPGKTVLNLREYADAQATAEAVRAHPAAAALLASGEPEVTITWDDAETGLPCKARIDWLGLALVDLKTIGTTNEREVARLVARNLYHGQLAHYTEGLRAIGIDVPAFLIVAEGKGAQDVAVFEVDDGMPDGALYVGRKLRARLMRRLKECVDSGEWPGRHPEVQALCLPQYALDDSSSVTFADDAKEQP